MLCPIMSTRECVVAAYQVLLATLDFTRCEDLPGPDVLCDGLLCVPYSRLSECSDDGIGWAWGDGCRRTAPAAYAWPGGYPLVYEVRQPSDRRYTSPLVDGPSEHYCCHVCAGVWRDLGASITAHVHWEGEPISCEDQYGHDSDIDGCCGSVESAYGPVSSDADEETEC